MALAAWLLLAPASAAAAASPLLARLESIPAPSGGEDSLRASVLTELPGWCRPEIDALGDLVVDLGGEGPVHLVSACLDEPAFVVSAVDTLGYLRVARLAGSGRLWDQFHVGQRFRILTGRGPLAAVSAAPSIHLRRAGAAAGDPFTSADLWLDAGFHTATEAGRAGVAILDPITLSDRWSSLAGTRAAGTGLESRCEVLALLRSLLGARPATRAHWVAAFTAQGQPGGRGLRRLIRRFNPAEVCLLGGFPRAVLGKGPVVASDSLRGLAPEVSQRLLKLGGRDVQRGVAGIVPDQAGLDALARVPAAVLGLPVRYARSPVETLDEADVNALAAFLRRLMEAP